MENSCSGGGRESSGWAAVESVNTESAGMAPLGRRVGVRIRAGDLVGSERRGKLWEGSADGEK